MSRKPHRACGEKPAPDVIDRGDLERLRLQYLKEILRDLGGRVLLEDPDVAIARDVVLEALKLDAPVRGDVVEAKRGKIRQTAIGTDRAELTRLGDDLLLGAGLVKGLEDADVNGLGPNKRTGSAFGDGHRASSWNGEKGCREI